MTIATLPTSAPFLRYRAIMSALMGLGDSSGERYWMRFAAQSAVLCPEEPDVIADGIRQLANTLHAQADWYQGLTSPARFAVAALLIQHHLPAKVLIAEHHRIAALFRSVGLPYRGFAATMAVVIMHTAPDVRAVGLGDCQRLHAIFTRMRRFPWWITGTADLPLCAALGQVPSTAEVVVARAEDAFQQLQGAGLATGSHLHTAACLLVLTGLPIDAAVARYLGLKRLFVRRGEALGAEHYDALAVLSLLDHRPETVVERIEAMVGGVIEAQAGIAPASAFTIASDLVFLELLPLDRQLAPILGATTMRDRLRMVHAFHIATTVVTSRAGDFNTTGLGAVARMQPWPR